jgi:predicted permease
VLEAVHLLGSVTIPLSLLLIGAQLGGMTASKRPGGRGLSALVASRLLVAPLLTVAAFQALAAVGWTIPAVPLRVAILVSAMPVAVTCGIIVERYGGAVPTAARAIFVSTLASIVTVPLVLYAIVAFVGVP